MNLIVSAEPARESQVEVVERKGIGHPDTICDGLAEALSRALSRRYLTTFGEIRHHNVDKALLCAGCSEPAFGGGRVTAPMDIYLAGRVTLFSDGGEEALREVAVESARDWLKQNLHALDAREHVRIHPLLRPASTALRGLFTRSSGDMPRANDTSLGVGYAPASPLERVAIGLSEQLNRASHEERPAWGEDIKILGVRVVDRVDLTIACAIVDAHVRSADDYAEQKEAIETVARALAEEAGLRPGRISVNAGDRPAEGDIYLTVTGTSAEAGDDGQVGRGNRVNGLITPFRPMSLEAAAGKNPVSHVGKIYNVAAFEIADAIVRTLEPVTSARCLLVSRIGSPITEPDLVHVALETVDGAAFGDLEEAIAAIVDPALRRLPARVRDFLEGGVALF
jgi:S-adenosylmethionine synthetase